MSVNIIKGKSTSPPRKHLIPLNVKAPIYSADTLWATKATPHISAVKKSISEFFSDFIKIISFII